MKKRTKIVVAVAVVLAAALITGVTIYAATSYGTESDPLVTLSYLSQKLKPEILSEVQSKIDAESSELSSEFDRKVEEFADNIGSDVGSSGGNSADTFSVITLYDGQVMTCSVGTEIMLRIGSAYAYGDDEPVLVDTTTGTTLADGYSLSKNHMYMVTIVDNGIEASSSVVKVLVRGQFEID